MNGEATGVKVPPRRGNTAAVSSSPLAGLAMEALATKEKLWEGRYNWKAQMERLRDPRLPKMYGGRIVELLGAIHEVRAIIESKGPEGDLGRAISRLQHCEHKALVKFEQLKRAYGR
jgi:hypothetical protein